MSVTPNPLTTKTPLGELDYPTSDGKPMGETDLHRSVMVAAIETLKMHYAGQLVYVSGNILVYYRPGNKRRHVSPDVMVVRGLEQRDRENYLLWDEGRAPNVVIEVTSESTRDEDLEDKLEIYRDEIGVAEYFLFDPRSEYLNPALQGHRLRRGRYVPILPVGGGCPARNWGCSWRPTAAGCGSTIRRANGGCRRRRKRAWKRSRRWNRRSRSSRRKRHSSRRKPRSSDPRRPGDRRKRRRSDSGRSWRRCADRGQAKSQTAVFGIASQARHLSVSFSVRRFQATGGTGRPPDVQGMERSPR